MCSASSQAIGEGMDAITRSNSSASNLGGVLDQVIASLSLTGKPKSPSSLELEVVRWGRSAYSNIQKFNKFLLVVNVTALTMNFIAACSTGHVPLTAVQLLWVNSIMATSGVFALATDLGDLNHVLVTFIRGSCKLVLILVAVATLFGAAEAIAPEAASGEGSIQAESSESDNANLIFGVIAAIGVFFSIIGVVTGVVIAIVRQAWRPSDIETGNAPASGVETGNALV